MSDTTITRVPAPSRELSNVAAIVGVGETDYHLDYKASRAKAPGYELPTPEKLVKTAFERALADSGLKRSDIDGLSVSLIYGGPDAASMAQLLDIKPRYLKQNGGLFAGPLQTVCADMAAGECDTVVMVYAAASRAIGRQYGGTTYQDGGAPTSYYYYNPWGWSSQAAHWALMFRYYQATYGISEADLGAVAVKLRQHAMNNSNAVMQAPLSIDDYMSSRYIVRPLHLFDICLVNDGAVCFIVRRADKARDLTHKPVLVSGWGESFVKRNKMHSMVRERLRPQLQAAGEQALQMADRQLSDIQHFEGYDTSTFHLLCQLEGYGFSEQGAGLELFNGSGNNKLHINTAGGMLSEAYMHGWNHVAEITRQLRHEAGVRQVPGVETSMFSLAQTDQAHPIIFTRGA